MNPDTYAVKLRRWIDRAMVPALRWARDWLLYICAASQMADLTGIPVDEKAVETVRSHVRRQAHTGPKMFVCGSEHLREIKGGVRLCPGRRRQSRACPLELTSLNLPAPALHYHQCRDLRSSHPRPCNRMAAPHRLEQLEVTLDTLRQPLPHVHQRSRRIQHFGA